MMTGVFAQAQAQTQAFPFYTLASFRLQQEDKIKLWISCRVHAEMLKHIVGGQAEASNLL